MLTEIAEFEVNLLGLKGEFEREINCRFRLFQREVLLLDL